MKHLVIALAMSIPFSGAGIDQLSSTTYGRYKTTDYFANDPYGTPAGLAPAFAWSETTFDFGKIRHNAPVTHEFRFVNNGSEPLIISSVQASCGCTVAKYSRDPVAPGAEGFVIATYNAAAKGIFNKTVTVNANTDKSVVLSIKGEVE